MSTRQGFNPYVAIRQKCMECCGNSRKAVEDCTIEGCPLHPLRNVQAVNVLMQSGPVVTIEGQMDIFEILKNERKEG